MSESLSTAPTGVSAKPKSRWGLYGPFLALAGVLLLWSIYWFVVAWQIEAKLAEAKAGLQRAGYHATWKLEGMQGYPFRMYVRARDVKIIAPTGVGLKAALLGAEANAYALDHWIMAAPEGLTLIRGKGGAVAVRGKALRASASGLFRPVQTLAIEFLQPVFTPAPGAAPFSLAKAEVVDAYLRPTKGAQTDGDVLLRVQGAVASEGTTLNAFSRGQPVNLTLEGTVQGVTRLNGATWSEALQAWIRDGGRVTKVLGTFKTGTVAVYAKSERLGVTPEGRLDGVVPLEVEGADQLLDGFVRAGLVAPDRAQAAKAMILMGQGQVKIQSVEDVVALVQGKAGPTPPIKPIKATVNFRNNATEIGDIRLADAPRIG